MFYKTAKGLLYLSGHGRCWVIIERRYRSLRCNSGGADVMTKLKAIAKVMLTCVLESFWLSVMSAGDVNRLMTLFNEQPQSFDLSLLRKILSARKVRNIA